jgi:hypothetical protein
MQMWVQKAEFIEFNITEKRKCWLQKNQLLPIRMLIWGIIQRRKKKNISVFDLCEFWFLWGMFWKTQVSSIYSLKTDKLKAGSYIVRVVAELKPLLKEL